MIHYLLRGTKKTPVDFRSTKQIYLIWDKNDMEEEFVDKKDDWLQDEDEDE